MTFRIYRLPIASGVVRVRKPGALGILAQGGTSLPMLSSAVEACAGNQAGASAQRSDPVGHVHAVCRAALLDGVTPDDLTWADRISVFTWATKPEIVPAMPEGVEAEWQLADVSPLVKQYGAILVDMAAQRYGVRPSTMLGVDREPWALELDIAMAYRGLRHEQGDGPDSEVEVEDIWGNKRHVPRSFLPTPPEGATVMHGDWLVEHYGIGVALGAGGEGCSGLNFIGTVH